LILDSGANISLIQPYVGQGENNHVDYFVKGVTGQALRTQDSRYIEFQIGKRTYRHNFIIAPFSMRRNGAIGLDALKALKARADFATNRLSI
jgi:hypothetical protein